MTRIDPDQLDGRVGYAVRHETPAQVLWNRVSVTGSLFATALVSALVLGRKR